MAEDASFSFESGHQDLIHDVQIDFYGKTLASASSDRCIRVFEISQNKQTLIGELRGHNGPVWKLSWAHPKHGTILASCGYDRQVIIWKLNKTKNQWDRWFIDNQYSSSVNCIQFAPSNNLELIAGCSDGSITIYSYQNNKFIKKVIANAHDGGVNSISWSTPSNIIISSNNNNNNENMKKQNEINKRFVSGGCDNMVKIWNYEYKSNDYKCRTQLKDHENWVRDVAWSPIPGSTSHSIVASCSEDKSVIIWKEENKKWSRAEKINFDAKVWSVSWSELGNILAVALGENTVQLFKEGNDGKWKNVTKLN